jgi:hypothetical protein
VKAKTAAYAPGNLSSPDESGCYYAVSQENDWNDNSVIEIVTGPNERTTCSKLKTNVAADDFPSWRKKRKTSLTLSDVDRSFMVFVNMKKS